MTPYADNLEYLLDELSRIDRLIQIYLERIRADYPGHVDEFMGLYVSEDEINSIQKSPGFGNRTNTSSGSVLEEIESTGKKIKERQEESLKIGRELRLHALTERFGLNSFEVDVLLIALAPELDLKYEKIYSYLQNDVTKKRPCVDLILNLLCPTIEAKFNSRVYFSFTSPLVKNRLIVLEGSEIGKEPGEIRSLISSCIRVDEEIINFLLGFDELDSKIQNLSYLLTPARSFGSLILPDDLKTRLKNSVEWHVWRDFPLKFLFQGPQGSGKKTTAEAVCYEMGMDLLVVDSKALLESRLPPHTIVPLLLRETLLRDSALYFEDFDILLLVGVENFLRPLLRELADFPNWVFLAGSETMKKGKISVEDFKEGLEEDLNRDLKGMLLNSGFLTWTFPLPPYPLRKHLWEVCLDGNELLGEVDSGELASKFRFTGGQIKDAVSFSLGISRAKNPQTSGLSMADLYEGCKARSNQQLSTHALKINPHYTWTDIVLPKDAKEQLREVCNFIKYRGTVYSDWGFEKKLSYGKGLNVLFSGPSGTGKTMAAEIIAGEVHLDLYKVDLSGVVSKYIGETEKNLNRIFKEAETSNSILFFDEADALFGKRSEVRDSHDRYANIETAYLLQKMEEHEGTVILATNMRKNMDEAFLRRLHFTTEFPFPDEESRIQIWKNAFPEETPLEDNVDFSFLSKFKLTGGNIKNISLAAAFLAADSSGVVGMEQLIKATKRELQKIGKLFTEADFGGYSGFVK